MGNRVVQKIVLTVLSVAALIILILSNMACYQLTPYTREAFVPAPQAPQYHGEPLGRGHVEIRGQVGSAHVMEDPIPDLHDDALWIPAYTVNASALVGVAPILDLGVDFSYAYGRWAKPSTNHTPPMPDGGDHVFTMGPQIAIGGTSPNGKLFGGGTFTLQWARIPWSEWRKTWSDSYEMIDEGIDNEALFKIGFFFGGRPVQWMALFGGIVLQSAWINDGFSEEPRGESTLSQTTPTFMPLTGIRFDVSKVFFETTITFPISTSPMIDYFPVGWSLAFGVRI